MTTIAIITVLSLGCIIGGCSYVADQPQYKQYVQPQVDKVDKFIQDNLDKDQDFWDRQEKR